MLALFVVMLGAYTRLTDAGLGCPDWPGCYGHMVLPTVKNKLMDAQQHYPQLPIESGKAWTEMAHRYVAGTLALFMLGIGICVLRARNRGAPLPWVLPSALILLIIFQALLGMWTVTLKLLPVVVMGHLLGGMLIFAGLAYFRMQLSSVASENLPCWRNWISLGIIIVFCQIALGGWVSSNYAGVACIGFPQCNGQWWPALHFYKGFNLFSPVGANYQGGLLDNNVRVTIQFIHRLGAFVTAAYVLILSGSLLIGVRATALRKVAALIISLIIIQFALGVANVVYLLPLWVAVAHNGTAALLLAMMFVMRYLATGGAINARQY
jgi:cytochrome c oxidase assembly protein subunit 15